jgi:hypothetical protein
VTKHGKPDSELPKLSRIMLHNEVIGAVVFIPLTLSLDNTIGIN